MRSILIPPRRQRQTELPRTSDKAPHRSRRHRLRDPERRCTATTVIAAALARVAEAHCQTQRRTADGAMDRGRRHHVAVSARMLANWAGWARCGKWPLFAKI